MTAALRFGFVTCVRLGLDVMHEIYSLGGSLTMAMTLPDDFATDKSGRVYIHSFCAGHNIPLVKSPSVNDAVVIEWIRQHELDWLFIIGWSQIAGPAVLAAPRLGCIGMHPTLLPEGRGRASIPWAILKGLHETGVTMFVLDEGVDTGPILASTRIPITPSTTATELYGGVQRAHRTLIQEQWQALSAGTLKPRPQDPASGSTWPGRKPMDGQVGAGMDVDSALRLIRATTRPYPGAFWDSGGTRVRVWAARSARVAGALPSFACADGLIEATDFDREETSGR